MRQYESSISAPWVSWAKQQWQEHTQRMPNNYANLVNGNCFQANWCRGMQRSNAAVGVFKLMENHKTLELAVALSVALEQESAGRRSNVVRVL